MEPPRPYLGPLLSCWCVFGCLVGVCNKVSAQYVANFWVLKLIMFQKEPSLIWIMILKKSTLIWIMTLKKPTLIWIVIFKKRLLWYGSQFRNSPLWCGLISYFKIEYIPYLIRGINICIKSQEPTLIDLKLGSALVFSRQFWTSSIWNYNPQKRSSW